MVILFFILSDKGTEKPAIDQKNPQKPLFNTKIWLFGQTFIDLQTVLNLITS
jgi:hypothetical protein